MIAELGQIFLILALITSVCLAGFPLLGAQINRERWMAMARPAAYLQFLLLAVAFLLLTSAFITQDFSVLYVAQNSNSLLPIPYRISAVWGAHEGSLLLWLLILAGWTAAVALRSQQLPTAFAARVLGVLGIVSLGFCLFVLLTSNPFDRLIPGALDGNDLNPLLQDPGLIIHPPMLYMGYVGFAIPFAFAVAALIEGKLNQGWVRAMQPWSRAAWACLTLGIALGSWWAYYELGWGGWWFWDPVENASFMPWLVGTALLHSQAVTAKRNAFKGWTLLLAVAAFSLSLLGTFLVRSGVLTSVHAFASDPERGLFILIFLSIVCGGALSLYALRAPRIADGPKSWPLSRESLILVNNLILMTATAMVLIGTLAPLVAEAFGGKISVGPPYFGLLFFLLMAPAVVLMPLGPKTAWRKGVWKEVSAGLAVAAIAAVLVGVFTIFALDLHQMGALGLAAAVWVGWATVHWAIKQTHWTAANIGMTLAHFGVAVFLVGVSMTEYSSDEQHLRVSPGETYTMGNYQLVFNGVSEAPGPNYQAFIGRFDVMDGDDLVAELRPEKRRYTGGQVMTESAIDAGLTRDLYVSLAEPLGDQGDWAVRVFLRPFVRCIWLGALLMTFGGIVAATGHRRARRAIAGEVATA
ncbi:MAG: c-type cytochrome biogenesis protein CcmF [Lysobacteraceae bacterium]|nr:MAG: c-type cytochrome biogenesis protein CcmF [Xanthomonadaceae bacterium]